MDTVRILAIDPGTATTGYGVVDKIGSTPTMLDYGTIDTSPNKPAAERLLDIYNQLNAIIDRYSPDVLVMERLFFAKNQTTAIAVGKACGVMQFAAARRGIEVVEYTPMEVKQAVVGYGGAEKKQIQYMVQRILNLKEIPKPDDAADALALAICHAHAEKMRGLRSKAGGQN
ncbi:MAG: crossover junction endodeoxyribonuclease RuvC [Armatimonadetes bacterium]|nr:crossover junction endodeoxyribonuclease RuvC [Armatimonadota bacterium]